MVTKIKDIVKGQLGQSSNDFMKIHREGQTLSDTLLAIYLRAMESDIFNGYKFQPKPSRPIELAEAFKKYDATKGQSPSARSEMYRKMLTNHPGYFKRREEVEFANRSNKKFLQEMNTFFTEKGMWGKQRRVADLLSEFDRPGFVEEML